MQLDNKQIESLRGIKPERIRKYLLATGWIKDEFTSEKMELFHHAESGEQIAIPLKTEFIDYPRRINEIIEILANKEKRNGVEIFNELSTPISESTKKQKPKKWKTPSNVIFRSGKTWFNENAVDDLVKHKKIILVEEIRQWCYQNNTIPMKEVFKDYKGNLQLASLDGGWVNVLKLEAFMAKLLEEKEK